jgi:catechol 2,3-dioxygenase-like lactoylglutathione lyase family enzyme
MAKVTGLGHFGVYVQDMPLMVDFYTRVLGMTETDRGMGDRIVFLSAQPGVEHHELALAAFGDNQKTNAGQISFHVDTLADLKAMYRKLKTNGAEFDRVTNHGIAFGCYFRDPEGNRIEVYWATGIDYPQPCVEPLDLEASDAELLQALDALAAREASAPHRYGRDAGKRLAPSPVV